MMELSFHSKEDTVSHNFHSSVSYEEESSVGEMLTELKKPSQQSGQATQKAIEPPEERDVTITVA